MGKAPLDTSVEHYIQVLGTSHFASTSHDTVCVLLKTWFEILSIHVAQPGAVSVVKAMVKEVSSGGVDTIFHIGDISYATGFLVEWDFFLHLINPIASRVSYMTAIGNHERFLLLIVLVTLPRL